MVMFCCCFLLRKKTFKKNKIFFKKSIDKCRFICYNYRVDDGRLAQLGEHLPYKQRVTGSSPVLSTKAWSRKTPSLILNYSAW